LSHRGNRLTAAEQLTSRERKSMPRLKMKGLSLVLAIVVSAHSALPVLASAGEGSPQQNSAPPQKTAPPASPDRGQQVFDQNCSRCHNPPEGFSPRISGAIALHMRVRANLSAEDYKALLHFLNP
jgi:mono/diheme cytochrome c family protein